MPYSLKWIAALLVCAILCVPVSLLVQHQQTERNAKILGAQLTGGDPKAGEAAIARYGCGGCHQIEGVSGAQGQVGPPLKGLAKRTELAGRLPNAPESMIRWIRDPQGVEPGNGMPNLGVGDKDGRDIAAYLYTLR